MHRGHKSVVVFSGRGGTSVATKRDKRGGRRMRFTSLEPRCPFLPAFLTFRDASGELTSLVPPIVAEPFTWTIDYYCCVPIAEQDLDDRRWASAGEGRLPPPYLPTGFLLVLIRIRPCVVVIALSLA